MLTRRAVLFVMQLVMVPQPLMSLGGSRFPGFHEFGISGSNDTIKTLGLHANAMTAMGVEVICEALQLGA